MGRLTRNEENRIRETVLSFLPEDGSTVRWADIERKARSHHMSPSTLSQNLTYLVNRRVIERIVDEEKKPPAVEYRLAKGSPQEQIFRLASKLNTLLTEVQLDSAVRWGISGEIPPDKRRILGALIEALHAVSQSTMQILDYPEKVRPVSYAAVLTDKEGKKNLHVNIEDREVLSRLGYTVEEYYTYKTDLIFTQLENEMKVEREKWERLPPIEQAKTIMKACIGEVKEPDAYSTIKLKPEDIPRRRAERMEDLYQRFWEMAYAIPPEQWDEEFKMIMREAKQLLAEKIEEKKAKTRPWAWEHDEQFLDRLKKP